MRILVTGGAGFIGSHIAERSLMAGHAVCVLDNLSSGRRENVPEGARFEQLDLADAGDVASLLQDFRPDLVSHQAAQTSVSVSTREAAADARDNVLGTVNLLEACASSGTKRLVYAATGGAVYGEIPEGERAKVDWPPRPESPYACSKLAGEHYVGAYARMHDMTSVILRYANVYGPRQDPHGEAGVVAIFANRLIAGQGVRLYARTHSGDAGCIRDYVFVSDIVRANLAAIDGSLPAGLYNLGTGQGTTTEELLRLLEKELGVAESIERQGPRPGDVERSVLAPAPELEDPTPLSRGLAETARWFKETARQPRSG